MFAHIRVPYTRKSEDTDVPRAELSLASRLELTNSDDQQSTVAERPLLPLSHRPELLEVGVDSVSPVPSRIARPWRRVSQVRLRGSCTAVTGLT